MADRSDNGNGRSDRELVVLAAVLVGVMWLWIFILKRNAGCPPPLWAPELAPSLVLQSSPSPRPPRSGGTSSVSPPAVSIAPPVPRRTQTQVSTAGGSGGAQNVAAPSPGAVPSACTATASATGAHRQMRLRPAAQEVLSSSRSSKDPG